MMAKEKLPHKTPHDIAKYFVELIWGDDHYRYRSRELWKPLLDTMLVAHSINQEITSSEFKVLAMSEIDEYWKKGKRELRSLNSNTYWKSDDEEIIYFPKSMKHQVDGDWYLKMVRGKVCL